MLNWLIHWLGQPSSVAQRSRKCTFSRLCLEPLEDRQLPSADVLLSVATDLPGSAENEAIFSSIEASESSFINNVEMQGCWLGVGGAETNDEETAPAGAFENTSLEHKPSTLARFLYLDGEQPQDDGNSCGPNSAARVLRYYAFHATYADVKRSFHIADPILSSIGLGAPAASLAGIMQQFGYQATAARVNVERVRELVSAGKPVVTLIRVGTIELGIVETMLRQAGSWPALHWIAVQGFDRARGLVYFTDTDGSHHQMTFAEFEHAFNWTCASDLANKLLDGAGVNPGSIVY
jgi:Peptidase_C39 like family